MIAGTSVGIIGAGDVVERFYVPALAETDMYRVRAVASRNGVSARQVAVKFDGATAITGYQALITRDDIDAVFVCTPPYTHREIVEACLCAGKPTLVEKPVCANYADWRAVRATANRTGVPLYFAFNNRLREENQHMIRRALSGELGPVRHIDLEWLRRKPIPEALWCHDPALAGGGVLADLGSHLIMIALTFLPRRKLFRGCLRQPKGRPGSTRRTRRFVLRYGTSR